MNIMDKYILVKIHTNHILVIFCTMLAKGTVGSNSYLI